MGMLRLVVGLTSSPSDGIVVVEVLISVESIFRRLASGSASSVKLLAGEEAQVPHGVCLCERMCVRV